MKLDDIDKLNAFRADWKMRRLQEEHILKNYPHPVNFNGQSINDPDILAAVKAVVLPMVKKKLDEAKTRLMMLGVDEFPE